MGSCVTKNQKTEADRSLSIKANGLSIAEEARRSVKDPNRLTRKNLKQKAAVVDARLQNNPSSEAATAHEIFKKKNDQDLKLISSSLQKHFIFNSLTNQQKNLIVERMRFYEIEANQVIFEQNSKGTSFFIISAGRVEVIINGNRVNVLKSGESFGELALLHDTPRSASVRTIIKCNLWSVDRGTFRTTLEELNAQNFLENKKFIDSISVFEVLSEEQREILVGALSVLKFTNGSKVVNEGDPGDLLYIIKEGSVVCTQKGREVRVMNKGDYFGEQALYYGSMRTATVTAAEDVILLALGRENLVECLGASLQLVIYKNSMRIAFKKNEYLSRLNKDQQENLINEMQIQSYEAGSVVVPAGTLKKESIMALVKGELKYSGQTQAVFKLFDVLGANEVINSLSTDSTNQKLHEENSWESDLIAINEVDITHISNSGFFNCIGGDYNHVTAMNEALTSMRRVQIFKALNNEELCKLVSALKTQEFADNEIIVEQNSTGDKFYLIKTGKVEIIKDGVSLRTITKDDYFGERSLLLDEIRSASVIARKKVICWVMSSADFKDILSEKIRERLMDRIKLQDDSIKLEDLVLVKTLGNGMFGNVFLVAHKEHKNLYALKAVDRRKITAFQIEENIVLERKILLQLDHTLIMKLVRTFKDQKRLYFLLEYIRGMDLFDVLRKLQLLKECDAKFYVGCIIVIIEHLHEREIIYRDLKPENMVVDAEGYPKLIDFGTAKFIRGRTYTIVGTPHYMAPEVVTGHGYGLSADYWTVGIMAYEFLFGYVPFGEDERDPYNIYEKIQERRLVFPQWIDNKNKVKEFISQLLSKNPASRLSGSFDKLKSHPWFIGLNWDKITSKELKAPYVPKFANLDIEIDTAFRSQKNLDEVISRIENSEDIPKCKRRDVPPADWDEDF
ncbi:hypothetical protein SteCoe_26476 [Stentor coeruleus]|uniref:cGMP-dependent protein kinase n=1 Tax=Stentor coeruleus TaxID=5963 RepID=A0A1R2BCU5_9CILI|nr:hypothetical protein SteCoe_26476 [Stentor coeruleus]